MSNLVQITSTVISANAVIEAKIANNSVGSRQIIQGSITFDKLGSNANLLAISSNVDTVQSNLTSYISIATANDGATLATARANDGITLATARANDGATLTTAIANDYATYVAASTLVTNILDGTSPFTGGIIQFNNDILVSGDFTVEGNTFTANVGTITSEDSNIVLNYTGSNATAIGGGIGIEGTGAELLSNITFYTVSNATVSGWRVGTGTLTEDDSIARIRDIGANDYSTYYAALANDGVTLTQAYANDYSTYTAAYLQASANDFTTFTSLTANINLVSSNVDSMAGTLLTPYYNVNTSTGTSNVFYIGSSNTPTNYNYVSTHISGISQPNTEWILNSANNTLQFTENSIPSGLSIQITAWVN